MTPMMQSNINPSFIISTLTCLFCFKVNTAQGFIFDLNDKTSPCSTSIDNEYRGIIVNCQNQGISTLPLPIAWIPEGATTLLLDTNLISLLNVSSFVPPRKFSNLRSLGLSKNKITRIEPFVFSSFNSMEMLDLSGNQINLDREFLSGNIFAGLRNLSILSLVSNGNALKTGSYPDTLFDDLPNLVTLSLDTFRCDLHFGSIFNNTKGLSMLTLSGGLTAITNNTFINFQSIRLKNLLIVATRHFVHTDNMAFRNLMYLDHFTIYFAYQAMKVTLESLAPFVDKTMDSLIFHDLRYDYKDPSAFANNSIVTKHMARHLSKICIEHLIIDRCKIFLIEQGILSSPTFRRCLRYLDLGFSPIKNMMTIFLDIAFLENLEYFRLMDGKYYVRGVDTVLWQPPICIRYINPPTQNEINSIRQNFGTSILQSQNDQFSTSSGNVYKSNNIHNEIDVTSLMQQWKSKSKEKNPKLFQVSDITQHNSPHYIYPLPRKLTVLIFNTMSWHLFDLDINLLFIGGDRLEELYIAGNTIRRFTKSVSGLPNLKLLDISNNEGTVMSPSFFDSVQRIEHLNMAQMKLDINFMSVYSERLFLNLTELTTLDLSNNGLLYLSENTFKVNAKLTVLILAGNRFESVPFDLKNVPNLCFMDLRGNFLKELSDKDITSLEDHRRSASSFFLSLDGNSLYCGCGSIRFLSWMQRTRIQLDNKGNYSCSSDFGRPATTAQLTDLEAMWRKCHGEEALLLSLVLACLAILGFLCFIMVVKFKTQLKSFFLKTFWAPFILKNPDDYPIGVYIGYADYDVNLACFRIRRYIEEDLGLSTYVRHRDLLPASDMAESIMDAIQRSWRVLVIVTEHFLDDPWSHFIFKTSAFSVQADNPGRFALILAGEDNQDALLLARVPNSVLQAVHEESIIVMSPQGNISYENLQALNMALRFERRIVK